MRGLWIGLLVLAVLVAIGSIVLIVIDPTLIGSWATLVGQVCLIIAAVLNLRHMRK